MSSRWVISTGRDGSTLHVFTYDRRARMWEAIESAAGALCGATGGRLFGHGLGEWAWRVPVGRARWDNTDPSDPWLENSLAGRLNDVEQALCRRAWIEYDRCKVADIPVDRPTAKRLWPDIGWWLDENEEAS